MEGASSGAERDLKGSSSDSDGSVSPMLNDSGFSRASTWASDSSDSSDSDFDSSDSDFDSDSNSRADSTATPTPTTPTPTPTPRSNYDCVAIATYLWQNRNAEVDAEFFDEFNEVFPGAVEEVRVVYSSVGLHSSVSACLYACLHACIV